MAATDLARLEPVDLRKVWQNEPEDFTPWLAKPDNISLLGETLGLELDVESTEAGVGPYRADIVCRDTADGSSEGALVLIENQLERTNHSHLGQLLTYAAGLDAVTVVWIAALFTEEHRAALDWLNEKTDQSVNFFGLEIELWRIASSAIAPKFNVVAKPNDWNTSLRSTTGPNREVSETRRKQLEFWIEYKDLVNSHDREIRCAKPIPRHWMAHSIGRGWVHFSSVFLTGKPIARVELVLTGDKSKDHFAVLELQRNSIEEAMGVDLNWRNPPNVKRAYVDVTSEFDFRSPDQRESAKEWLFDNLVRFHEVLKPRALALDTSDRPHPSTR